MSNETQKRAQDSEPHGGDPEQLDEHDRGTLAAPEPTSGVVERATGLPAEHASDRRDTPKAHVIAWDLRDPSEPDPVSWDQRDTPQFDLWADRTASVSLLSPEEADRHAERICPAWEEPEWARQHGGAALADSAELRDLARAQTRAALWRALPADEADHYAARIRPSWQTPLGPPRGLFAADETARDGDALLLRMVDSSTGYAAPPDAPGRGELAPTQLRRRVRAQQLRGWLIAGAAVGSFVVFLALALSGPPIHTVQPAATERGALSAANAAASLPQAQAVPRASDTPQALAGNGPRAASSAAAAPGGELGAPGTVRVRVSAEPERARIRIDGVQVANPFDSRNPGGVRHRVVVAARGYQSRDFTLSGEHDERIRVSLVRLH